MSRVDFLANQVTELQSKINKLELGLTAVEDLINDSTGVEGLHLNGDLALWTELRSGGSFEDWLIDFDEALSVIHTDSHLMGDSNE